METISLYRRLKNYSFPLLFPEFYEAGVRSAKSLDTDVTAKIKHDQTERAAATEGGTAWSIDRPANKGSNAMKFLQRTLLINTAIRPVRPGDAEVER
jgi:hypothetical protein